MHAAALHIRLYEPRMKEQIIALTEKEYPFMKGWFRKRFEALYESDYMNGKNLIVAGCNDEGEVKACISYVRWPLVVSGRTPDALQMVGLIVDEQYRGKGVFAGLLRELDRKMAEVAPEAVIGFPVEVSKPGFVKQGWNNLFDLQWYLSPVNLLALPPVSKFNGDRFVSGSPDIAACDHFMQTANDGDFWKLRENFSPEEITRSKKYRVGDGEVSIIFRIQKKAKLPTAVIGKIFSGKTTEAGVITALKMWKHDLRKSGGVVMAAAAVNELCPSPAVSAIRKVFYRTSKKFSFIVKSYKNQEAVMNATGWNIMPADMETW